MLCFCRAAMWGAGVALGLVSSPSGLAAAESSVPATRFQVPATVSPDAARDLTAIYAVTSKVPPETKPVSIEDWDRIREALDKRMIPASNAVVARLGATVQDDQLGGVPVVRIRPANYTPGGGALI